MAYLRVAFVEDRVARVAAAPLGATPPGVCRYCRGPWQCYRGSRLDGHAKCIVSDDFKRLVDRVTSRADVTDALIAETLGVSRVVVRSWWTGLR